MDPHYSVLLGDDVGHCDGKTKDDKKGVSTLVIATVIPVVVGVALIAGFIVFIFPRYTLILIQILLSHFY